MKINYLYGEIRKEQTKSKKWVLRLWGYSMDHKNEGQRSFSPSHWLYALQIDQVWYDGIKSRIYAHTRPKEETRPRLNLKQSYPVLAVMGKK